MTQKLEGLIQNNSQSSIEVKRGQKGDYGWDIKIYFTNPGNWIDVIDTIDLIDEALRKRYLGEEEK